jgi:putative addiction module CopG family antidote
MRISIDPATARFIEEQVKSGRYKTREDVVKGALAALQSRQEVAGVDEVDELRSLIAVGIEQADRGEVEDWDVAEIRAEGRRLLAESQRKRKPTPRKKAV